MTVILYRDNQDVFNCTTKLEQFPVPIFMLDKMKNFIKSVQGKAEEGCMGSAALSIWKCCVECGVCYVRGMCGVSV